MNSILRTILLTLIPVVLIRPHKVDCDIPGHLCTSGSLTGQYQTTRHQVQPLGISLREWIRQVDTKIHYRRGSRTVDMRAD